MKKLRLHQDSLQRKKVTGKAFPFFTICKSYTTKYILYKVKYKFFWSSNICTRDLSDHWMVKRSFFFLLPLFYKERPSFISFCIQSFSDWIYCFLCPRLHEMRHSLLVVRGDLRNKDYGKVVVCVLFQSVTLLPLIFPPQRFVATVIIQ